ncbi:MAG: sulfotransferase family 2 domain-containing protein [Bacteroidota bacterium]
MISHHHHTIFVHVPKVAGQSIETVFLQDLGLDWDSRGELLLRKKKSGEKGPHRLAHLTAEEYTQLGYTDADTFRSYFTFTFVRHPYARVLSLYHYLGYSRIISVEAFIDKVLTGRIREHHFFFRPQYEYAYDAEGRLLVEFVGKLERIAEDIKIVFKRSGLDDAALPHVNKSEKGLKRGLTALLKQPSLLGHFQPRRLFSNKKTKNLSTSEKDKVYALYAKDFTGFDYER